MNVFERTAKNDAMKAGGIVTAWTCFAAAIDELIPSYNANQGVDRPALIVQRSDTGVVVECVLGPAKNHFNKLMLTVTARMDKGKLLIAASIELWEIILNGARKSDSRESFTFVLDIDPATEQQLLNCGGQQYSPYEAAELLLGKALLR